MTAPRVTPEDIEANIASERYFTASDGAFAADDGVHSEVANRKDIPDSLNLLTFCVLVLRNGFTVTGESACASPENFDAEVGRKIARQNAVAKIWPLMGYELRSRLAALKCMTPEINGVTVQLSDIGIAADNGLPISADGSLADPELFGVVAICTNEQFDDACRETDGLNFGLALEALQRGHKLARAGWNGKGMFIYYVPANTYPAQTGAAKSHFGDGSMVPYNAYLAIKNVNETVSTWVPSVNDCLAEDWEVLP